MAKPKSAEKAAKPAKPAKQYNFNEKHPLYEVLNQVIDPEISVGIADMGLIYDVKVDKKGNAKVIMTLTSMGCPAGSEIATDIDGILCLQDGINGTDIELVWDPPWTPDMMKPELKEMLFGEL